MKRLMSVVVGFAVACVFYAAPLLAGAPDQAEFQTPMGKVTFKHKAHVDRKVECKTCHHKDEAGKEQACKTCHQKADTAGGAPSKKIAVHGKDNKSGTCLGCHMKDAKAPQKCPDCHKK